MKRFKTVVDATNRGGWIHKGMLHPDAWIASPGIPLSLDDETCAEYEDRIIHDYLEIGAAVMLGLAL